MGHENPLESVRTRNERYAGLYRGIVRDSFDPEELNRVKVEVLPMFQGVPIEDLPWAVPVGQMNRTRVPQEGATVLVHFESDDIYKPMYHQISTLPIKSLSINGVDRSFFTDEQHAHKSNEYGDPKYHQQKADDAKTAEDAARIQDEPAMSAATEYPYNDIFMTPGGIIIELDDTPGHKRVHVYHPAGAFLEIDNDGTVHIHSAKDFHKLQRLSQS